MKNMLIFGDAQNMKELEDHSAVSRRSDFRCSITSLSCVHPIPTIFKSQFNIPKPRI